MLFLDDLFDMIPEICRFPPIRRFLRRIVALASQQNDIFTGAPLVKISHPDRISLGKDVHIYNTSSSHFLGNGEITIGEGTYIGPNVGLITQNHDLQDLSNFLPAKGIVIGDCCWLGMNVVILPGVVLGNHTIVGAGSVVTHNFPEGHCLITGNPAKMIKRL